MLNLPEGARVLFFHQRDNKGKLQWQARFKSDVGDKQVTTCYVVPENVEDFDGDYLWVCIEGKRVFTSPDGCFEIIEVHPQERLVPKEMVLDFELVPHKGEEQWQAQRPVNGKTVIYIPDQKFDSQKIRSRVRWTCRTTRVIHRSEDGNFLLVSVMPREEQVSARCLRRRARKEGKLEAVAA